MFDLLTGLSGTGLVVGVEIALVAVALVIAPRGRAPSSALAWVLLMALIPLLGIVLGFLLNKVVPGPWIAVGVVGGFVAGIAFALFLGNREKDSL